MWACACVCDVCVLYTYVFAHMHVHACSVDQQENQLNGADINILAIRPINK